jgi:heme/copper-type cytochrome/quinol oxidase subunit 4
MKKTGFALVAILVVVAVVVVFSGVLQKAIPLPQLSPTSQQILNPDEKVNKFPVTFLGDLKDKKVKLDSVKAQLGIVDTELTEKIGQGQEVYNQVFGTIKNPGIVGDGLLMVLTAVGTWLAAKSKLYTPDEVKLIQKGETII